MQKLAAMQMTVCDGITGMQNYEEAEWNVK